MLVCKRVGIRNVLWRINIGVLRVVLCITHIVLGLRVETVCSFHILLNWKGKSTNATLSHASLVRDGQ